MSLATEDQIGRCVVRRIAGGYGAVALWQLCHEIDTFADALPAETILHAGRNLLFRIRLGQSNRHDLVIKRCPIRQPIRRVVYSMRASKGIRAFDNAVRLLELGVDTPEPLAAVEIWRDHLPVASYYCCRWVDHWGLARDLKASPGGVVSADLWSLGRFVAWLHCLGVFHHDLTGGNILLCGDGPASPHIRFSLVDLNRVCFFPVGKRLGLANLAQLGRFSDGDALLEGYCEQRGLSPGRARPRYEALLQLRRAIWTLKNGTRHSRRKLGL